ncbi:winged helix-turn-helix domain-containing protein [Actinomadura decatromicini]|uniref:Response regulator transcription factor n=1 Tax=Actinomadura decatromicini TaxID=2604572 RepID=A0A5D3FGU6_9ACTN|nr:response regulator transcription factor [Actinomadura decatromicini]TYK48107.1 response regulator transcription factor [Actinomadura decatromicini]
MRVLVVEDDADLRRGVEGALRSAGLAVDTAPDLPEADEALAVNDYDCAVFDRILPAGDALGYVRRRRDAGWTLAVLFLTARDSTADRVDGFEHGGDDYLVKPFAIAELIARVRNLCRRGRVVRPPVLRHAGIELDTARREARRAGVLLTLTGKEFAVLEQLMIHEGAVVGRDVLIEHCWDAMAEPMSNVVDVAVAGLRRKLGDPPPIATVRGAGYRLT